MSAGAREILDAAFLAIETEAENLSAEYQQRLSDFRVHALAVLDDLGSGRITPEQAETAALQEKNAVVSVLLSGGYDAAKAAQASALNVVVAVLKAAIIAAA